MDLRKHRTTISPSFITAPSTTSNNFLPQRMTLRRRCRSECLQMGPTVGGQSTNALDNRSRQYDYNINDLKNKISSFQTNQYRNALSMNSTLSKNQQQYESPKKITPNVDTKKTIHKNHKKENISSSVFYMQDLMNSNPEIMDLRDSYIHDMEIYKEKMKTQSFIHTNNMKQFDKYKPVSLSREGNDSPDKHDTNKRRFRARSESEPHELYNTKTTTPNGVDRNRGDDMILKRAREDKPSPQQKIANGVGGVISTAIVSPNYNTRSHTKEQQLQQLLIDSAPKITNNRNLSSSYLINKFNKVTSKPAVVNGARKRANTSMNKLKPRIPLSSNKTALESKVKDSYPKDEEIKQHIKSENKKVLVNEKSDDEAASDFSDADSNSFDGDDDLELFEDDLDSLSESDDSYKCQLSSSFSDKSAIAPTIATEGIPGRYSTSAPLCSSLFPHVPPYITFASHTDKGPPMPFYINKILKWKLTTITPIVVRKVLLNSGFRLLKKTNDWVGIWGKHMKSPCFKTIRSYQKFNHIPGTFQIGRKDQVWRNLQIQMARHGKKEFGFMPRTYILPQDIKLLRQIWPKYSQRNVKWIIKPPASARGTGIKVVNRWSQIPKRKPLIVQRYIERPLLINGSKFDLRLYVLLTSINPLRIYMHTDGLARFASVKYSEKSETLNDRYMHLTNYSINKLSSNYAKNEDAHACKGHKWTIKSLWSYLSAQGINTNRLWGALRNLVLRTVLAGEGPIYAMSKANINCRYNCYELFGIDVLLDSELIPWLLEVNISPSLHSASPLDLHVKGPLVRALLNTALYQVPPKLTQVQQNEILLEQGLKQPLCYDKRVFNTALTKAERLKHNHFTQRNIVNREDYLTTILEDLTPDDIRCLLITEDELARSAPLERIFPAPNTHKYLMFTENPRYYNRLLDAWDHKYAKKRDEGVAFLSGLCAKKIHLQVPPPTLEKDSNSNETNDSNDTKATSNSPITCKSTDEQDTGCSITNGRPNTGGGDKNNCNSSNNTKSRGISEKLEKKMTFLQAEKGRTTTVAADNNNHNVDYVDNLHYNNKSDTDSLSLTKYKHVITEVKGGNGLNCSSNNIINGGIIGNGLKSLNKHNFGEKKYDSSSDYENNIDNSEKLSQSTKTLTISIAKPGIAKC